jgi:hypothetical protein
MFTTVRRWFRAFFCPSAWVTVDPAPDLRQERIARDLDAPVGEVPALSVDQADRLMRDIAAHPDPAALAQADQHRAAYVSRDGIPYDVETADDPADFEHLTASALHVLRHPWTGSADDRAMAERGILVPGVTL